MTAYEVEANRLIEHEEAMTAACDVVYANASKARANEAVEIAIDLIRPRDVSMRYAPIKEPGSEARE